MRRWLLGLLGLAGAGAFAVSVQAGKWWVIEGAVEIGPHKSWRCFSGDCVPAGMSWIGAGPQWERFGIATWASGLLSAFLLIILSATVASGRAPKLLSKMVLVSMVTALLASTMFIAKFPGLEGAGLDRGAWLYIVGMVLGSTIAISTLRTPPPA